jgi:hypothetical protein
MFVKGFETAPSCLKLNSEDVDQAGRERFLCRERTSCSRQGERLPLFEELICFDLSLRSALLFVCIVVEPSSQAVADTKVAFAIAHSLFCGTAIRCDWC